MPISDFHRWRSNQKPFSRTSHGFESKLPETCPCPLQNQETAKTGKGADFLFHTLMSYQRPLTYQRFPWTVIERKILRSRGPLLLPQSNGDNTESCNFQRNSGTQVEPNFPKKYFLKCQTEMMQKWNCPLRKHPTFSPSLSGSGKEE